MVDLGPWHTLGAAARGEAFDCAIYAFLAWVVLNLANLLPTQGHPSTVLLNSIAEAAGSWYWVLYLGTWGLGLYFVWRAVKAAWRSLGYVLERRAYVGEPGCLTVLAFPAMLAILGALLFGFNAYVNRHPDQFDPVFREWWRSLTRYLPHG